MRTKRIKKVTAALMTLVMGLMMNIQAFADIPQRICASHG